MDFAPLSLKPKDALAHFRQKGLAQGFDYSDVWQAEHAKAFTVAKMMSRDLLETTRQALDQAMTDGQTFEQFKKNLAPKLQAAGWWGRKQILDPVTGQMVNAQLGSNRRLKTIFATNMRVSYQVGNWQRAWATRQSFPFLRYIHNDVRYPRPEHVAWHGTIRPIDDPWWNTHYPPCAWGCQCSTESLSQRMMDTQGYKVTDKPASFPLRESLNTRTGEVTDVEQGIDPAWNYNVGKSPLRGLTPAPAPSPHAPPPDHAMQSAVSDFLGRLSANNGRILMDRDKWPVPLGPDLFKDAAGKLSVPRLDLLADLPKAAEALAAYDTVETLWSDATDTALPPPPVPPASADAPPAIPKAYLIRRYTKRLDKHVVTVDFSRDAWTYDVQPVQDQAKPGLP